MKIQTTEYQIALGVKGVKIPRAWAILSHDTTVEALSIDGACRLAVQAATQFQSVINLVGSDQGFDTTESEALQHLLRNKTIPISQTETNETHPK